MRDSLRALVCVRACARVRRVTVCMCAALSATQIRKTASGAERFSTQNGTDSQRRRLDPKIACFLRRESARRTTQIVALRENFTARYKNSTHATFLARMQLRRWQGVLGVKRFAAAWPDRKTLTKIAPS